MFGILLSAFNVVLSFVVRSIIAKFFVFFALYLITTEFLQVLVASGIFPSVGSLNSAFGGIPSSMWYFMQIFAIDTGISMMVSAAATAFLIRRIPVIG
ncbi:DUF2523 family protein [Undibacterium sp. Tian12W]|uniref:DUF2523 family protein n=1 Tax=Undibacterium sp. Tian12W TaxID=3413054 RepID=UPI003BF1F435